MIKCGELSAAQRRVLIDYMAQVPFVDVKHQFDGATVTVDLEPSWVEEIANADLRAALIDLSRPSMSPLHSPNSAPATAGPNASITSLRTTSGASAVVPPTSAPPAASSANVRSVAWLRAMIDDIYTDRWRAFETEPERVTPSVDDLSVHTFGYLSQRFGVDSLVKQASMELLSALRAYRPHDFDIQLFGLLLGSASYDTVDLRAVLRWRRTLLPFTVKAGPQVPHAVHVKQIPALVRKCLVLSSNGSHSGAVVESDTDPSLKCRVRRGLTTWCNLHGAFPSLVADPNFYCPPFHRGNPYVGRSEGAVPSDVEQMYAYVGQNDAVIDVHHLLLFLMINLKQERIAQRQRQSPPRRTKTPLRRSEPDLTSVMSPTFASMAKLERPNTPRSAPRSVSTGRRRGTPKREASRTAVADIAPADAAALSRFVAGEAVDVGIDLPSSPPLSPQQGPQAPALNRARTLVLSRQPSFGDALIASVPLPTGTSLSEVQSKVDDDMELLEAKLARVVNSFVRNRPSSQRKDSASAPTHSTSAASQLHL